MADTIHNEIFENAVIGDCNACKISREYMTVCSAKLMIEAYSLYVKFLCTIFDIPS